MVDVFLATGHMARTIMSCDDGQTWINDRSQNDNARCWTPGDPNFVECDHTPYTNYGSDSDGGWFYANYGWGYNGSVRRSQDGVNWQILRSDGWGGGLAYQAGRLFLQWEYKPMISSDGGLTFRDLTTPRLFDLDHPIAHRVGSKFMLMGRPFGNVRFGLSRDYGVTWEFPASMQAQPGLRVIKEGNGRMVAVGAGRAAYSSDDGRTWTMSTITANASVGFSELVFDGTQFLTWGNGRRWASPDGQTWTSVPVVTGSVNPSLWEGPVSFNPATGQFVMITHIDMNWYNRQRAFRSRDGITWSELPATSFRGGHPILRIISGKMDRRFCP